MTAYWILKWRVERPIEESRSFSMRFNDKAMAEVQLVKLKTSLAPEVEVTNGDEHVAVHPQHVRDPELRRIEEEHIPTARELGLQGSTFHDDEPPRFGSPIPDPWGQR